MHFAVKVIVVLPAPLLLARTLAGYPAFRLAAITLMVGITCMGFEPNPTVATLSESRRAHRLPPVANQEEYDKRPRINRSFARHDARSGIHDVTAKKKENDPFGSSGEGRKRTFQIG